MWQSRFATMHDNLCDSFNDYLWSYVHATRGSMLSESTVTYQDNQYEYNDLILPLSTDVNTLLRQLGPLDGVMFHYKRFNASIGCTINYADSDIDFKNHDGIVKSILENTAAIEQMNGSFINMIAEWMSFEVKQHDLAAYSDAVMALQKLVHADKPAGIAIHEKFYVPELNDFTKEKPMLNELMKQMFDPAKGCDEKEKLLSTWMNEKLNSVPGTASPTLFAGTKPETSWKDTPQKDVSYWFKNYEVLQRMYWLLTLDTLNWKLAYNGGPYAHKCNDEVQFLREAKMFMNSDGLMELEYKEGNSAYYGPYYPGESKSALFEPELRHACKLLGLEFQPGIDFHDRIIFTPESTRKLMDGGYHITESYMMGKLGQHQESVNTLKP